MPHEQQRNPGRKDVVDNSPLATTTTPPSPVMRNEELTMPDTTTTASSAPKDAVEQAKKVAGQAQEKFGQAQEQAQEKVSQAGEKVTEQADAGIDKAAEGLQGAADKLRETAEGGSGVQAQASAKVADTLETASTYLRDNEAADIMDDVEQYVREHPMQALAGAVIGGFVLARVLR